MATARWTALLMLLLSLTLSPLPPALSTRSIDNGVYEPSAWLSSLPDSNLGLFREDPTTLAIMPPHNMTLTTKLKRIQRRTSSLSPKESFLLGLKSSAARASRLSLRSKGVDSRLYATSGIFTEPFGHAMEVQFGTPPQASMLLLVDTASSLTWTQCSPCSSCVPQKAPLFDPSTSTSYAGVSCADNWCSYLEKLDPVTSGSCANTCQYKVTYGDGTFSTGEFAQETMTLGGGGNPNVYVGCGHNENGYDGYDGVVGLDSSSLSLVKQLGKFSVCFLPDYCDGCQDSESTPIVFGNPSFPADSPNPGFAKTFPNPITHVLYYYVNVASISVNGVNINVHSDAFTINSNNGGGGVIIDSGTSFTVLHDDVFDALVAQMLVALPTNIKSGDTPCWPVPGGGSPLQTLPSIVFHMFEGNMGIAVEGTYHVMGSSICLAMARSTDRSAPQVIGSYQMTNQFLIFDPQEGQVQFNTYDCNKLVS